VYYDYESDANGAFSVLAGYEKSGENLEEVMLLGGKYLCFASSAKTPDDNARIQAVIETWGKVWEYFSDENSEFKRSFKTDFEYYKNAQDIEIFISIR
jgi:predicted transcriptional regulator YdeE